MVWLLFFFLFVGGFGGVSNVFDDRFIDCKLEKGVIRFDFFYVLRDKISGWSFELVR